ncbi:hypothetical protein [Pseudomonas orientalis]|uniref:hypothetical protein n=1 Tax=Pseudomonas orientalis TaxID=76758 RepID=UPI0013DDEE09|nr:hypothetical protein [Pseudomonas orientalis]
MFNSPMTAVASPAREFTTLAATGPVQPLMHPLFLGSVAVLRGGICAPTAEAAPA